MLHFLRDQWTLVVAVGFLTALFGWSWRSLASLPTLLRDSSQELADAIRRGVRGEPAAVQREGIGELIDDAVTALRSKETGHYEGRIVLSEPLDGLLQEWAEEAKSKRAALVWGASYTGIALVFTFGLIAWVLFVDVRHAISAGATQAPATGEAVRTSAAQATALADAVAKMGFKFVISCAGIVAAIAHGFVLRATDARLAAGVRRLREFLSADFIQHREVELRMREQHSRELAVLTEAVRESTRAVRDSSTSITGRLERLQAIEVSVKDLGEEVTRTLGTMVQDAMADHIKTFLGDIRDEAEKMRTQMETSLRGNLGELAKQLGTSLDGIQKTLQSQSSSDLEKLLGKLQDVVTGGFSSETRNMAGLVEQLQSVISQLSNELGGVGSLLRDTLDGFQQQHNEQQALLASVTSSTQENVKRLGDDLVREGSDAMTRVLTETNARILRIMAALDDAATTSAGRSSASVAQFEALAGKVKGVTEDLGASAELVSELMRQVQGALQASSSGVSQIADAATKLKAAADTASATMRASDDARRALEASLQQQAHLTARNASSLEKMESVWPQLLQDVARTVESTTGNMLGSWEKLSDKLAAATTLYGQTVGDRVDDLQEAVAKMTEHVKRLPEARR
ncbi:hypothetical protein [Anaeromyxobacter sp. SG66]|uniref:hypothetical protein n=1 Tax=Anaeromyxobacter sp. SG66 TaxID=2925410 RepID=UPI001F584734|nr:hypothetical protein [Anaeromyxobacter sp. SG66]